MKKNLSIVILVILVVTALTLAIKNKKTAVSKTVMPEPVDMCYQYNKATSAGYIDRASLEMHITGNGITGTYKYLPAEKDSKTGSFTGIVGPMDPKISGRTADVWWDAEGEGVTNTEQLQIVFGEGSAVTLFGEMIDRGDGTYIYKDTTILTPGFQMSQTDCKRP